MSLTDIVNEARKSLALGAVGIASLLATNSLNAADKNITPDWNHQEINAFLNATPTQGDTSTVCEDYLSANGFPNGETCPANGDTIIFNDHDDGTQGTYIPPIGNSLELRTGVTLQPRATAAAIRM